MLEVDLIQCDLELLGQQHGHRGVRALSHLDLTHDQGDASVLADADEPVRRERRCRDLSGRCGRQDPGRRVEAPREKESATGGRARDQEPATGQLVHSHVQAPFEADGWDGRVAARLMASRIRG